MNVSYATLPPGLVSSPLEDVLVRAGATLVERAGRRVASDFGSAATEVAVCMRTVGLADRSDRATLELRGEPASVDRSLTALADWIMLRTPSVRACHAWWWRVDPAHAIVRCDGAHATDCIEALAFPDGAGPRASVTAISGDHAAIGVIGPKAEALITEAGLATTDDSRAVELRGIPAMLLRDGQLCYELIVACGHARAAWESLWQAGQGLGVSCVGHDALERLVAGERPGGPVLH